MQKIVIGGLAAVGVGYLGKELTVFLLKKYRKEILAYISEKLINYIFTDEDGENSEDDFVRTVLLTYLEKKKGAGKNESERNKTGDC